MANVNYLVTNIIGMVNIGGALINIHLFLFLNEFKLQRKLLWIWQNKIVLYSISIGGSLSPFHSIFFFF